MRADGRKELIALADRYRKSSESWADLLRSCKRRGMAAPTLAVGDGALGFWAAVREAREQRCWFHKQANVLAALPKSAHPNAIKAMQEIYNAEDEAHARSATVREDVETGFAMLIGEVIKTIPLRRERPRNDLISFLTQMQVGGELISDADIIAVCNAMIAGGMDATTRTAGVNLRLPPSHPRRPRTPDRTPRGPTKGV